MPELVLLEQAHVSSVLWQFRDVHVHQGLGQVRPGSAISRGWRGESLFLLHKGERLVLRP